MKLRQLEPHEISSIFSLIDLNEDCWVAGGAALRILLGQKIKPIMRNNWWIGAGVFGQKKKFPSITDLEMRTNQYPAAPAPLYQYNDSYDIDVFFCNKEAEIKFKKRFAEDFGLTETSADYNGQAYTFLIPMNSKNDKPCLSWISRRFSDSYYKINIIGFNYKDTPLETIKAFDLTPCQVAIDHNLNIIVDPEHFEDIGNRNMEFIDFEHSFNARKEFLLERQFISNGPTQEHIDIAEKEAWAVLKRRVDKYAARGFEPGATIAYRILQYEGTF